jgi:hypothetical protein
MVNELATMATTNFLLKAKVKFVEIQNRGCRDVTEQKFM